MKYAVIKVGVFEYLRKNKRTCNKTTFTIECKFAILRKEKLKRISLMVKKIKLEALILYITELPISILVAVIVHNMLLKQYFVCFV